MFLGGGAIRVIPMVPPLNQKQTITITLSGLSYFHILYLVHFRFTCSTVSQFLRLVTSDIRKYFSSSSGRFDYNTMEINLIILHQAQVKWYVLSLVGGTRSGKSSHGYILMMFVVHSVVYAKNGPAQPPH